MSIDKNRNLTVQKLKLPETLHGFKPGHAWGIYRLHLDVSVEFPNSNMAKLFCKNLSKSASTNRRNKKVRIKW